MPHPARFVLPVAIVTTALLGLSACSSGGADSATTEAVTGGTLVYASGDAEPDCLDPHVGGNYPQALAGSQVIESLVSRDSEGTMIPWLATDWTVSADGLTWDFTLRDDVSFTDGTPFDAAAVKTNIEHLQDPETASSTGYLAVQKIAGIDVVDAEHVRFTLSAPDSALLESLSQSWVGMESPDGIARGMDENCKAPIGTGPFIVADWVAQDHITFERNDDYNSPPADAVNDGPVAFDRIEWRFIPDSASRYAALQSGDVDMIDNVQPDVLAAAQKSKTFTVLDAPRTGASNRIELNAGKSPFNDERVREAFARGIDIDAGIQSLFFGTVERSTSPLSSAEPAAYSEPDLFTVDTKAANALLDEAGWDARDADGYRTKDGARLTLAFPVSTAQSIPAEQSLFDQIAAGAKDLGMQVKIELMDLSSWYAALGSNDYDLVSAPYTKVGPDVLRILYHSSGITPAPSGYFANHAQVSLPALDALLDQASASQDAAERTTLYERAQKLVLDGYYIVPLYDQLNTFLINPKVAGVRAMPTLSTPTFVDAHFTK
ncbi:peptide/nickel transport system substrate-binding protein [Paramicrobacterium humi]|uniref:Peptide/nickel transport system substrate-binding protein n=1 Tax=Paramicrobacterium humi TaxID=640635 RepID=A0A1H4Q831_9MICO|nr:ABC transporter substrate-binding protein [Microbacterium humi]SEC15710.1 peptide/nickel transport system substrate-binding protein [Microbacterium humi]